MTPQEAIEILEINAICSPKATKFKEAVEVAKQALENQIPIKPVERFPFEVCTRCGRVVNKSQKYCPECGQALDWSDTE